MDSLTFDDFDAFAASVQDADLEIMIRNPGRRRWELRHLEAAGIHLQQGDEGSGGIAQGRSRSDGYVLFFPLSAREAQRTNGRDLPGDTITILEPGCEFCITAEVDHRWCTVFLPTDSVGDGVFKASKPRVRHVAHPASRQSVQTINQLFRAAEMVPGIEATGALDEALTTLRRLSSQVLHVDSAPCKEQGGRPSLPRDAMLERLKQLLDSRQGRTIGLRDLAAACGASERTTRNLFREYFGASPQRFLQLRQLHQVRRALRASSPAEVSVSQVMLRHGVLEFGRFAGRYRKMFGELPSATLANGEHQVPGGAPWAGRRRRLP